MHIGQHFTLKIEKLILGGEALGRKEGLAIFVPYGAPGDEAEVEITQVCKDFARAKILQLHSPSASRIEPPCPYFYKVGQTSLACGGCSWQHLSYEAQMKAKEDLLAEAFERTAKLSVAVEPIQGMSDPWRWRAKVQVPFARQGPRVIAGFYAPKTHWPIDYQDCLVQPPLSNAILQTVKSLMNRFRLPAYEEKQHQGWLRHLLIRMNKKGEAQVVFVTARKDFPHQAKILQELRKSFPEIIEIHQNYNPRQTNVILGETQKLLWRQKKFTETIGPVCLEVAPGSFLQVNPAQAEVLYQSVKDCLKASGCKAVLDLYSGVGSIALYLASEVDWVLGVEEDPEAVRDAQRNAEKNHLRHCHFLAGKVEHLLPRLVRHREIPEPVAVVLDPPRAGCDPRVLEAVIHLAPQAILYVSCDPASLARDIKKFVSRYYTIQKIQPVDMFPQTAHIESVTWLKRSPV